MAKVTSKLQVTIPKSLAEEHRIKPGDDIEWSSSGRSISINRAGAEQVSLEERLRLFDAATARQQRRQRKRARRSATGSRGWTREDLHRRGSAR